MKRNFALVLVSVIMLAAFTGCELAPSIPEILTTVKGYNNEIIALVLTEVVGSAPETFTEESFINVDDGIICKVDSSSVSELNLIISLDNWAASDGTKINGSIRLGLYYYDASIHISVIETDRSVLHLNRTSAVFEAVVFDGDPATEAFTYAYETFYGISLLVEGKPLIANLMIR